MTWSIDIHTSSLGHSSWCVVDDTGTHVGWGGQTYSSLAAARHAADILREPQSLSWVLNLDSSRQWRWQLKKAGEIIVASVEGFDQIRLAQSAAESVLRHLPIAEND